MLALFVAVVDHSKHNRPQCSKILPLLMDFLMDFSCFNALRIFPTLKRRVQSTFFNSPKANMSNLIFVKRTSSLESFDASKRNLKIAESQSPLV